MLFALIMMPSENQNVNADEAMKVMDIIALWHQNVAMMMIVAPVLIVMQVFVNALMDMSVISLMFVFQQAVVGQFTVDRMRFANGIQN